MKNKYLFVCLIVKVCLTFTLVDAVEERDWTDCWPNKELPGTESLPSINANEIDGYSFSVTYALDGGRFGDQLTNYLKALWVSWKFNLPIIYRPFDYSDQLMLSDYHEVSLNDEVIKSFSAKLEYFSYLDIESSSKVFNYLEQTTQHPKKKLLWNIGLLTPLIEEHFCEKMDDEEFRSLLQKLVKPKHELPLIALPKDCKTIALHVRTGVGYDLDINIRKMPTKFPPTSFYLSCLKLASLHYEGQPLYIHIFTDHPEPTTIKERFYEELTKWGIENVLIINCRETGNFHTENVLEDMFSMMHFDCLIHPDSSLSRLAAIIAAPSLEMKPSHWAEYRKDPLGNPVLDKQGSLIVDPIIIERLGPGKPIKSMSTALINDLMLF